MNIEEFKHMSELLERIIHKYTQIEQRPWDYGNGILLSRPEIHTIMIIAAHSGVSVTELARLRGITKGAASQLVYKMVDKGLVEKRNSPHSDAQVSLFLTGLGQETSELHDVYHKTNSAQFFNSLQDLPDETYREFVRIFTDFDHFLDERLHT